MDHLSKHLEPAAKKEESKINLDKSWMFNPTMDDAYKEKKKIDARKEAILLASRVDRSAVNDIMLKERTEFESTPKYLSVTRRLYNPFPDMMSTKKGMASTMADSQR